MSTENPQETQFTFEPSASLVTPQEPTTPAGSAAADFQATGVATAVAREPQSAPQASAVAVEDVPEASASSAPAEGESATPAAETSGSETAEATESAETMDQLMDQFATQEPVAAQGEVFEGHVLAVTEAGVVVDVGGKFEGLVPAQEFLDSGSPIEFGPGQTIEVERLHEQKDGYVLLSHLRAHRRRVWERIEKAYRDHTTISGKIVERIKGGLVVNIGVRAYWRFIVAPGGASDAASG